MIRMTYTPSPIDTRSVSLPESLTPLIEELSAHAHDLWANARLSTGWTYGSKRDDDKKHHPCLVHYSDLSEVEKELDRGAVLGTLKAIVALGYTIKPKETPC